MDSDEATALNKLVELKSERGKPTPEQLEWKGFGMRVVRSLDELMKVVLCTK